MSYEYRFEKVDNLIYDFEKQLGDVSPFRRGRVLSCKNGDDRRRSLAATLLLGELIEKRGLDEKNMRYAKNGYGKPYFAENALNFSLSHSGEYAAAAVGDGAVGIDIQQIYAVDFKKIAKRFFTERECEYVKSADDFFGIWVMKESFIKAIGTGLSTPLNSFCIEDFDGAPYVIKSGKKYVFEQFCSNGYKIAICTEG